MGLLTPGLGENPSQGLLTPQERDQVVNSNTSQIIGQVYNVDRNKARRINMDLAIQGGADAILEAKARDQTTLGLLGKGIGNVLGTAVFELAKLPGYIAGGVGAIAEGDITPMVDNLYLDGVKWMQENTQNKIFEVYQPKAVREGDLLTQLASPTFWASEGANGVGFLLSFMVPGQLLKAAGVGAKSVSGLAKMGKLAEVVADGEKIVQGGNLFGRTMLKTLGKSGRALDFGRLAGNIESSLAVTVNTIFESAAEASEAYDHILSKGGNKEEASLAASQTFKMNLGLLAVSNTIVERYLFNGFGKGIGRSRKLTADVINGTKEIQQSMLKEIARRAPGAIATSFVREGFFEEGLQSSIQQTGGSSITDVLEKYAENIQGMFGDDQEAIEFGKAVVLGGVLGGGMGMIQTVGDTKRENRFLFGDTDYKPSTVAKFIGYKAREATPGAIQLLRAGYKALKADKSELFTLDQNGKINGFQPGAKEKITEAANMEILANYYEDKLVENGGNVVKTNSDFAAELRQAGVNPQDAIQFTKAISVPQGLSDKEAIGYLRHQGHKRYLDSFMQMEGGAELARAHIEDQLQAVQDRYESNTGVKMNPEQLADIRKELEFSLESSQKLHEFINADHDQRRIGFNPIREGDENPENTLAKYTTFFNRAKQVRLDLLRDMEYFESKFAEDPEAVGIDRNERSNIGKVTAEMREQYEKMSSREGLQKIWDEWNGVTKVVEEEKAVAAQQEKPPIRRAEFWDMVSKAGYNVTTDEKQSKILDDDTELRIADAKGKEYILDAVEEEGTKKVRLTDPKNPSRFKLFDNIRALFDHLGDGVTVVPKAKILQEIADRAAAEARQKIEDAERGTRAAMDEKIEELLKNDAILSKHLENLNTDLEAKLKRLSKLKSAKTEELKKERTELRAEIKKLTALKEDLTKRRQIFQSQIEALQTYRALLNTAEVAQVIQEDKMYANDLASASPVGEEFKAFNESKLIDAVNQIDKDIETIDNRIKLYERFVKLIDDWISRGETNLSVLDKDMTQEFINNYSIKKDGKLIPPPNINRELEKLARGQITTRMDKHLDKLALSLSVDPAKLREQFINDAYDLKIANHLQSAIPAPVKEEAIEKFLQPIRNGFEARIKEEVANRDALKENKELANVLLRVKGYQALSNELNMKFRKNMKNKFLRNPDKAQKVSENDGGDSNYTPVMIEEGDPFWNHALSDELFGSTGVNIEYTKSGDDLYMRQGDQLIPVANPSKYQQTFFKWIAKAQMGSFQAEAVVAHYDDRDGEMQQAFAENNKKEKDRRPGQDVYVVIKDKRGKIVQVDGVPVFTAIRRVETKFPKGKMPKMNMLSLTQLFFTEGLGASDTIARSTFKEDTNAAKLFSVKARKAIATQLEIPLDEVNEMTAAELMKAVEPLAISWGKTQYTQFYTQLVANGKTKLPVTGITKGHPVRVLDDNGEIMTYSPKESLGLETHPNGKPKNFTVHKANFKGNITIGNKIIGGFKPGVVYVKKTGEDNLVPLIHDFINKDETDLVMFLINQVAKGTSLQSTAGVGIEAVYPEGMNLKVNNKIYGPKADQIRLFPQTNDKFSIINMVMMWGSNSATGAYDIYVRNGVLFFGDNSFSMNFISKNYEAGNTAALAPLIKFLQNKVFHISYDMLQASQVNGGKYYHPKLKDGKIVFEEHNSYLDYVFTRTKSDVVPEYLLERFNLPQFAQKNLQFGDPSKSKTSETGVPKPSKKEAAKPEKKESWDDAKPTLKKAEEKTVAESKPATIDSLPNKDESMMSETLTILNKDAETNKSGVLSRKVAAEILGIITAKFVPDDKLEQVLKTKEKLIGNSDYFSVEYMKKYINITLKDFSGYSAEEVKRLVNGEAVSKTKEAPKVETPTSKPGLVTKERVQELYKKFQADSKFINPYVAEFTSLGGSATEFAVIKSKEDDMQKQVRSLNVIPEPKSSDMMVMGAYNLAVREVARVILVEEAIAALQSGQANTEIGTASTTDTSKPQDKKKMSAADKLAMLGTPSEEKSKPKDRFADRVVSVTDLIDKFVSNNTLEQTCD